MSKQVIAIDIDDVLADQAEAFLEYSNKTWGTQLKLDDYTEHLVELWSISLEEVERRAQQYHQSGTMRQFRHKSEALPILKALKHKYDLVVVTSRRLQVKDETLDWINEHFSDVFSDIHFAGFFDTLDHDKWKMTKADIVRQIGASYLIDDQLKHCYATADVGIETILFGEYHWNTVETLPPRVYRCANWTAVGDYFGSKL